MTLIMSDQRKGYSKAVIDGFKSVDAAYICCLDSDGQYDARDFWKFWSLRNDHQVIIGWRVKRSDVFSRRLMSGVFKSIYQILFHVPIHDPSCPFLLIRKEVLEQLVPELGILEQGFWWEFVARAFRRGFSMVEIPINHLHRAAGKTQVYKLKKLPGIGISHFLGILKIWYQTRG